MKLHCTSFSNNEPIPGQFAFCVPEPDTHVTPGCNRNPGFEWSELPEGTKSMVLLMHDPDAPSHPDDVNQAGRVIPADLARVDFHHWVLVDIPADVVAIQESEFSRGVVAGGKESGAGRAGVRQGINDYTKWFDGDPDMQGSYFGYDGPCPPWNDSIIHHYHFTLYALSIERCPVGGEFTGPVVLAAIEDHVLDQSGVVGTYSLNPELAAPPPKD